MNLVHVDVGHNPVLALHGLPMDRKREILGHDAVLVDDLHARRLKVLAERAQLVVAIELSTVQQSSRPREDGRDRVRRRLVALLPLTVVARHRPVCSLALDHVPVGCDQLARHHAQGAEALREDVRLHVAVVVLARPDEAARGLDRLRNHVVDQPVLVVDARSLEGRLVVAGRM